MYKSKRKDMANLAVYIFQSVFGKKKESPEARIVRDILDQKVDVADFIVFVDHLSGRPKFLRHEFNYEVGFVDSFMEKRNTIIAVFSNVVRKTMARQKAEVFYSAQDIEQMLKVPANIVQSLFDDESIKAIRVRKEIRVRKSDFDEYLKKSAIKHSQKPAEQPKQQQIQQQPSQAKSQQNNQQQNKQQQNQQPSEKKKKKKKNQSHIVDAMSSFMTIGGMPGLNMQADAHKEAVAQLEEVEETVVEKESVVTTTESDEKKSSPSDNQTNTSVETEKVLAEQAQLSVPIEISPERGKQEELQSIPEPFDLGASPVSGNNTNQEKPPKEGPPVEQTEKSPFVPVENKEEEKVPVSSTEAKVTVVATEEKTTVPLEENKETVTIIDQPSVQMVDSQPDNNIEKQVAPANVETKQEKAPVVENNKNSATVLTQNPTEVKAPQEQSAVIQKEESPNAPVMESATQAQEKSEQKAEPSENNPLAEKITLERIDQAVENIENVIKPKPVDVGADKKIELVSKPVSEKIMNLF